MTKQTNKNKMAQNLPANLVKPTYRHAWPYHANEENLHHPKSLFGWLMEMENIKNLPLVKILTFYKWMWEMVLWPFTPHRYHTILIVLSPIPTPSPNPSPALAGALKHQLLRSVQHRLKSIFSSNLSLIFKLTLHFWVTLLRYLVIQTKKTRCFQALSVEKIFFLRALQAPLKSKIIISAWFLERWLLARLSQLLSVTSLFTNCNKSL